MLSIALDVPQFSQKELLVCAPGLPQATLKQWIERHVIYLSVPLNPGRGRRPLYRGKDVLTVAATCAIPVGMGRRNRLSTSLSARQRHFHLRGRRFCWVVDAHWQDADRDLRAIGIAVDHNLLHTPPDG